jgi:hypothetical protein
LVHSVEAIWGGAICAPGSALSNLGTYMSQTTCNFD